MLTPIVKAALVSAAVFALAFVVFAFIERSEQTNHYADNNGGNKSAQQRKENIISDSDAEEPIVRYNRWLMIFTGALAFVGIVQFGFLIRSDTVATTAAEAAKRSADIAEQTLRVSQGASIGLYRWESQNIEVNKSPYFRVEIANTGHSIAVVLNDTSNVTIDSELPQKPIYSSHPVNNVVPVSGASFLEIDTGTAATPIVLTQRYMDELMANKKKIFVWGRITYRDIFDDVWDYGYVTQFSPKRGDDGRITWRDISPGIEGYNFLTKRPHPDAGK
jgi:hypothetical protein